MKVFVAVLLLAVAVSAGPVLEFRNNQILDSRIIGGSAVAITSVPYQVSLQYRSSHMCGASIISQNYVVTAAHCTDGLTASQLTIRAGSSQWNSGGQVVNIRTIYQHGSYNGNTIDYDISVLQTSTNLALSSSVAAVRLPSSTTTWQTGTSVLVTGWGTRTEGSSSLPTNLQGVNVQISDLNQCKQAYGSSSITARMLCAGVSAGGKDACQGDSGGPLVANGVLAGVVSWGYGCARQGYPGIYSNVPVLRSFITSVSGL